MYPDPLQNHVNQSMQISILTMPTTRRLVPTSAVFVLAISNIILISFFSTINTIRASLPKEEEAEEEYYNFIKAFDRATFGLKKEKLSHLRFYWHDIIVGGGSATSIMVVQSPLKNSSTGFGFVNMMDNPLTTGPLLSSKIIGRTQGLYASASQQELGLLMVVNFGFTQGKYNGSTITVVGSNSVFNKVREMPVFGGSGLFRFSRGYAEATTLKFDSSSGNAIVEYKVYVLHY